MIFNNTSKYKNTQRAIQILICVALCFLNNSHSTAQNSGETPGSLLNKAETALNNSEYDKAIDWSQKASSLAIEFQEWDTLKECQIQLFLCGYYQNDYEEVQPIILDNHISFPDSQKLLRSYSAFFLGLIEEGQGNVLTALEWYDKAIPSFELEDQEYLQSTYGNMGTIYTKLGDYGRAEKLILTSLELNKQREDSEGYLIDAFNLAKNYFYKEEYGKSEAMYHHYLSLEKGDKTDAYLALSHLKTIENKLDSARMYLNLVPRAGLGIDDMYTVSLHSEILEKEGKLDSAILLMQEKYEAIQQLGDKREEGMYLYQLGELYLTQDDIDLAIQYFNESLQVFTGKLADIDSISALSENTFLFQEIWLGDVLFGLAHSYNRFFERGQGEKYKNKAKECLKLGLQALDYKRSFLEDIGSTIVFNQKSKRQYEEALNIYLQWYEQGGVESDLDEAFQLVQRHNAFLLRQHIDEIDVFHRFAVEDSLIESYLDIKFTVVENGIKLNNHYSKENFDVWKKSEVEKNAIRRDIEMKYPEVKSLKPDFDVVSLVEVQKYLRNDQALIKYFEGINNYYSFVITKGGTAYYVHENSSEIGTRIVALRKILSDHQNQGLEKESKEGLFLELSGFLGEKLIQQEISSLSGDIKKIAIVPSGILTQIPFEVLLTQDKQNWDHSQGYLIQGYAISYHYFCKVLVSSRVQKTLNDLIAFGLEYDEYTLTHFQKDSVKNTSNQDSFRLRSEALGQLFFADDEAREVAELFGGNSFTNKEATKENFMSHYTNSDLIHLSAHSLVDFENPNNSAIILTKQDSVSDHLLRISDLNRMKFDDQLVTLSACNTMYGKHDEGEGLMSMARSFIQSGAGSVVGSYWSVPDEVSKSFMLRFYSKLREGMSKDEALRATKLDFMTDDDLSSPIYRTPMYWSAWVVFGDAGSIKKPRFGKNYLIIAIVLLIIGVLVLNRRKRNP